MAALPNVFSIQMGIGSTWTQNYTIQNADGSAFNTTGKTWEFVIRNDPSESTSTTPVVKVTGTSGSQGVVTVLNNVVTVSLTAAATAALTQKSYVYSLWMDPGLSDATAWVTGTVFATQIANP